VDDSLGYLPQAGESADRLGASWTRERRLGRALPLHVTCQCTLTELSEHSAEISVAGHIAPTTSIQPPAGASPGVQVSVRGGHTAGHCTVDRQTGLPLRSTIERQVEMLVQPADGPPFVQHKHLLTTIESFPAQPAPRTALLRRAPPEPIRLDAAPAAALEHPRQ
jgi:hypothetical protein